MKKRSLVSAIAMLVVSAIVLTSATFAWFAAGATATVTAINANVGTSDGSITISADGTNWVSTLAQADLEAVAGNTFPAYVDGVQNPLSPVSFDKATKTFMSGALTGADFLAANPAEGSYIKFDVHVRSTAACTVTVTPSYTFSQDYIFAAVQSGSTLKVTSAAGAESEAYVPYVGITGSTGVDTDGNFIMNDAETDSANLGTAVATDANNNIVLTFAADDNGVIADQIVTFYLWAEGQDIACNGKTAAVPSMGITFAKNA